MLYSNFRNKHLASIDGGPLKLYLFFCFHADNTDGDSWYSIQKIAEFFNVQTITVDKWINALVKEELIYREQINHKSNTTYLLPYSTTLMKLQLSQGTYNEDNQGLVDDLISSVKNQDVICGDIVGVYHLFQWKRKKVKTKSTQWILIISKRRSGVLTGHYYPLQNSDHLGVNRDKLEETFFFKSPFTYNNESILGIALSSEPIINEKDYEAMKELIGNLEILQEEDILINQYLEYGQLEE